MAERTAMQKMCTICNERNFVTLRSDEFDAIVRASRMAKGPYDHGDYICGRRESSNVCIRAYRQDVQKSIREGA